jgi:hypothetical protein
VIATPVVKVYSPPLSHIIFLPVLQRMFLKYGLYSISYQQTEAFSLARPECQLPAKDNFDLFLIKLTDFLKFWGMTEVTLGALMLQN